ncbi:hypothetical protein [Ferrovibrio sp.]|uniref:hypothetical protein n=1 Tax=Ferrovibrio sp. TaxID=1917215 RepID=UPI001B62DA68|nr:hypothetical protein [Ferrovibrio sp.]MBP7064075.1 hypothetical protein [Ferrovibrio sp.]
MTEPASPSCAARFAPDAYMGFLPQAELQACLAELWRLAPDADARQLVAARLGGQISGQPEPDAAAFQALLTASLPKIRDDALHAALLGLRR